MKGNDMPGADLLRKIPSVDEILRRPEVARLALQAAPSLLASWIREALEALRHEVLEGRVSEPELGRLTDAVPEGLAARLTALGAPPLRRIINATGVVVHTNLGRAPLGSGALDAIRAAGAGYNDLEYDLGEGERGSRAAHLRDIGAVLFPGRALLAVNNNAAAVLLALNTLAEGREAIVSRGELVEIGGSFRIPEVMAKAGAVLREVGTTNRTRLSDYRAALGERTALLVKVHTSNYRIVGFVEEAAVTELAALGRERGVPLLVDEGSGHLAAGTGREVMPGEPVVQELLASGAHLVAFSGDKLLGGPQAGLLVGDPELVARCAKNPLARALRLDKMRLAALAWTLAQHAAGRATATIPVLEMCARAPEDIGRRAQDVRERLARSSAPLDATVEEGTSRVGGGAAPMRDLPTRLLAIRPRGKSANAMETALRRGSPPVIARIAEDRLLVDLRTVDPGEDEALAGALDAASR
jgi:L-seryl-tRNA(Ser) seleniumtransferase